MTKTVHLLSALSWDKGALCDAYQRGDVLFLFFFCLITCRVIDISLEHLLTLSHCAAQH